MERHFRNCKIEIGVCLCDFKRYWLIFGITVFIFGFEVLGGIISGSLSLLSDAGHVLGDLAATSAALAISYRIYQNADSSARVRALGAYFHGGLLILIAGWIIFESVERMRFQEKIAVTPMTVCAVLGGIGNYLQHRILLQGAPNLTRKGMQWHILSDLWQSVAVVLTGLLIAATGKPEIDLVASIMIAAAMLFGGCRLIFWAKNSHEHYD
ncbi:MAG TPA: cation diffusion facilitator family transporter [Candidatus Paceibacterota bacterium]